MADRKSIENKMRMADVPQYKPEVIKAIIVQEATRQGIPVELALAVAQQESGFNNKAVSKPNSNGSRDHGVMQLNDKYHKLKNVYDPYENIRYGVGMLKAGLAKNNGDIAKTLSDYNAGANATGKGRQQGDAYARKVMSIARGINPDNIAISQNNFTTGAAAPVPQTSTDGLGDGMAALSQGALTQGEKIVEKYIKDAGFDTKLYKDIRDNKQQEIKETLNEIKSLPTTASAEELQALTNQYSQAKQELNQAYDTAIKGIQSGIGADSIDNYYNKLVAADDLRIKRMQESNPYTKMAQIAPAEPIDINKLKGQQAYNAWASRVQNSLNPQAGVYDRAAQEARDRQQIQAARLYNATGLTPEQFIEGGLLDYKNMGTALNNQQQAMIQLLSAAQQGDRQAQQVLSNMYINQAQNNNALMQQQIAAKQAADAAAFDRAKFAAENARWGIQQGQNLDAYPLSGDINMQEAQLQQTGNIMNSAANRGVTAAGNMLNYQAMLQKADAASQQDPLKTYLEINKPVLSAAGMSQNIDALPNAITNYQQGIMQNFPQYARFVDPNAPVNAYAPVPNLTNFNVTGQNTFRQPSQQ